MNCKVSEDKVSLKEYIINYEANKSVQLSKRVNVWLAEMIPVRDEMTFKLSSVNRKCICKI